MLDMKTCKRILNDGKGEEYTEEEVAQIRELLWSLAQINFGIFIKESKTKQSNETSHTDTQS